MAFQTEGNEVGYPNCMPLSSTEYLASIETHPLFRGLFVLVTNAACGDPHVQAEALVLFDRDYLLRPGFTAPTLADIVMHETVWSVKEQALRLLNHCIGDENLWRRMAGKEQKSVKRIIFRAVHRAQLRDEVLLLARCLSYLMRYELARKTKDPWLLNMFRYLQETCSCLDPEHNMTGAYIYLELAKFVPETFVPHLEVNLQTLYNVLDNASKKDKWITIVVSTMLESVVELAKGGVFSLPTVGSYKIFIDATPLLMKALRIFQLHHDVANYQCAHELLNALCDNAPQILLERYTDYMRLAIELAGIAKHEVRLNNMTIISKMVGLNKHKVFREHLLEGLLHMSFNTLINSIHHSLQDVVDYVNDEPNADDSKETQEKKELITNTVRMLRVLVANLPENLLFEEFLKTLQPALISKYTDVRRTVQIILGNVVESLSKPLCKTNVEKFLLASKMGTTDKLPEVQCVAYDALSSFVTYLEPLILNYAYDIIPMLVRFLKETCNNLENPSKIYINRTHNVFLTLEQYCSKINCKTLSSYVPELMHWAFILLEPPSTVTLSIMSLSFIGAIVSKLRQVFMPYYEPLMYKIKFYLKAFIEKKSSNGTDDINLCTQVMETTARVAQGVGKVNFLAVAEEILSLTMAALTQRITWNSYMLEACYKLIGVLSGILPGSNLKPNYSILTLYLYKSISQKPISTGDEEPDEKPDADHNLDQEQEQAVYTLMHLAKNTPTEFDSYIMGSFQRMFVLIDYPHEGIRRAVCLSLTALLLTSNSQKEQVRVAAMQYMLMPRLVRIVREVENMSVAQSALECLAEIIRELGENALTDAEMVESIFNCMENILTDNAACMQEKTEKNEQLCQIAASILPDFGNGLKSPERFTLFFGRIPRLLYKLIKDKQMRHTQRPVFYEILINCIEPLGIFCAEYFYVFYPIITHGLFDTDIIVRSCAFYGIGQLMFNANAQPPLPLIELTRLMVDLVVQGESNRLVLDHFCATIARIIITNPKLMPLQGVVPLLFQKLPIQLITSENSKIVRCFNILYHDFRRFVEPFASNMIGITLELLQNDCIQNDKSSTKIALRLLRKLRESHYNLFKAQVKLNPSAFSVVVSLFKK